MSPNTKTDRSQSAPHDSLAQPDRADLAKDGRARAGPIEHPVLFVLVGAVALAGLRGGLSSETARNGLRSARRRPRPPRHPLRRRGRYLRPLLGQRRPDQAIDRPHRANDRQSRSNPIKGAVVLRATPTHVDEARTAPGDHPGTHLSGSRCRHEHVQQSGACPVCSGRLLRPG